MLVRLLLPALLWTAAPGQVAGKILDRVPFYDSGEMLAAVAITADGTRIAMGGISYYKRPTWIQIWDTKTRKRVRRIRVPRVNGLAFTPDGAGLASFDDGTDVTIWNPATGQKVRTLSHRGQIEAMVFSPNGADLVTAGHDRTVRLWKWETGEEVRVLEVPRPCTDLAYSRDGKRLAAIASGRLTIWSTGAFKTVVESVLPAKVGVRGVAFDPKGESVYTGHGPKQIARWSCVTGERLALIELERDTAFFRLSPDGETILTPTMFEFVARDARGKTRDASIPAHRCKVVDLAFTPDGRHLVSTCSNGFSRILDGATLAPRGPLTGHLHHIDALAYLHGSDVLVSGARSGEILLWDTKAGKVIRQLRGHRLAVFSVSVSKDDKLIASGGGDGMLKVWSRETGELVKEFDGFAKDCVAVAFTRDGKHLWAASRSGDVRRYRAKGLDQPQNFLGLATGIVAMATAPDGSTIAVAGRKGDVRVLDAASGKTVAEFDPGDKGAYSLAYDKSGRHLAMVTGEFSVQVWDLKTKRIAFARKEGRYFGPMVFAPDGGSFLERLWAREYQLSSFPKGRKLQTFRNDGFGVITAAFAPSGKTLVMSLRDGTLRLFPLK